MFSVQLKVSALLVILFLMVLSGIYIFNYKNNPVNELIALPQSCEGVCIFGIKPGKTTVRDATRLLQNHTWINDVRENASGNGYAQISWGWSGEQPDSINVQRRGRLTFYWDDSESPNQQIGDAIVETATIYTHISMFLFQQWYGDTSNGSVNNQFEDRLRYSVYYILPGGMVNLTTELSCPITRESYWRETVRMTVSIGRSDNLYIRPVDMIKMC